MNLYRKGDFVSQVTKEQCMAAAMQIMLNIIRSKDDRTAAFQKRLDTLAQQLSRMKNGGSEPRGWAAGLTQLGGGKYRVEVAPSRTKAILRAVTAMRATGRPVGLLVWRGAHSWVLHGYEATADPLAGVPFEVTHLYVTDPWYPRISSIWGPSRGPNARITPKQLEEDYLPWRRPTGFRGPPRSGHIRPSGRAPSRSLHRARASWFARSAARAPPAEPSVPEVSPRRILCSSFLGRIPAAIVGGFRSSAEHIRSAARRPHRRRNSPSGGRDTAGPAGRRD